MFTFLSCSQSLSYDSQTSESVLRDQKPSQGYTTNKHGDMILSSADIQRDRSTFPTIFKCDCLVDTYISECQKDTCFLGTAKSFFFSSV